jgi:antitoxin component of MazEF toxin-antitoxin module
MRKKLTKHGNSQVLVIDKPILDLLGWTMATELKLSTDGKRLIIAKAQDEIARAEFIHGGKLGE